MIKINQLKHVLSTRQIVMMSLGSAIGTGLFYGVGKSIQLTGPSILLSYILGGIVMYFILRALTEMSVYEPNVGSFSHYAHKYLGSWAGFFCGWNYWFMYIFVCMLELSAAAFYLQYWFPGQIQWLATLVILLIFLFINLLKVNFFGEFEFWFAGIKVVTVILMILFGVYIIFWGNNGVSTVSNVFAQEKFFSSGLDGFLASFVVVIFSFGGTELVGIMAGESKNPQKAIPLATRSVIFRIILFYIATIFIILCLYPWQQFNDKFSVFVDVFNKIGITKAADIINFVIITAALSSFNSGIYGTGRMLYNLSLQQNAPNMFNKVNKSGVPYVATLFSIYVIFIVVLLNYKFPHKIFLILISVATSAAIINWLVILFIHHIFRKKVAKDLIVFKMPFYPYSSLLVVAFFIIVIFNMFKQPDMKTALFITPIWLLFLLLMFLCKKFKIFL